MRRKHLVSVVVFVFLSWNVLMYYFLISKNPAKFPPFQQRLAKSLGLLKNDNTVLVGDQLKWLQNDIEKQLKDNENLLEDLRKIKEETVKKDKEKKKLKTHGVVQTDPATHILPVLMFSCDRITVSRSLDSLLKYRPEGNRFPIIVSQDCGHKQTSDVIDQYVKKGLVTHIKQPDLRDIKLPWPQKKFKGYYKIARHYKWAVDQIFHTFNYTAVIIVEDDLDFSPDFFEYFTATYPILKGDPTLWCVSAWNDNGKNGMVEDDPELLYRSDFFPGLGWMMEKHVWLELGPKWPDSFWDDWMRHPDQRKNRVCIRPEICRTSTFGKKGVSKGLFYDKHLKFIKLNSNPVEFTQMDLTYLIKENYDPTFHDKVYNTPQVSVSEVMAGKKKTLSTLRVQYSTKEEFKSAAKKLGIMDDFKAGVPRVAYQGVISFMHAGQRVYMAPPKTWKGYDTTWT